MKTIINSAEFLNKKLLSCPLINGTNFADIGTLFVVFAPEVN